MKSNSRAMGAFFITAAASVLMCACASMGRPEGGPRDETPPVYVRSTPNSGALNFRGDRLDVWFDENIQLEDAFNKVIVSPTQKQAAVVRSLVGNTEKAAMDLGAQKIVLAGGVSANSVLRRECETLCKKHGWALYMPKLTYCGDNAAMVGAQGYYEYCAGKRADATLNARATMGIDVG